MSISLDGADALVHACDKAGVQLFVVKQNRLNPRGPAPEARGRQRSVWPHLHGELHRALGAAAGVLRPGAMARDVGVRRRRVHEPGVPLRRPDSVAHGSGGERDGEDRYARPPHRDRGFRYRRSSSSARARSGPSRSRCSPIREISKARSPILGEKGSAKIGGTAVNKIEHWEFAEYDDDDKLVEAANTNPPNVYGLGHRGLLQECPGGSAGRSQAGYRWPRGPEVSGVDPWHLRVGQDWTRSSAPSARPGLTLSRVSLTACFSPIPQRR